MIEHRPPDEANISFEDCYLRWPEIDFCDDPSGLYRVPARSRDISFVNTQAETLKVVKK